ncbi:hypothetical protein LCGC14_2831700, partial [marine sediment metagenome]
SAGDPFGGGGVGAGEPVEAEVVEAEVVEAEVVEAEVVEAEVIEAEAVEAEVVEAAPAAAAAMPQVDMPSSDELSAIFMKTVEEKVIEALKGAEIREAIVTLLEPRINETLNEMLMETMPELIQKLLKEMGAEGYAGIPLYTRDGKPLGIFVVISKKPISDKKLAISMMTGYSERVSAEIERSEAEEALRVSEEKYSSLVERSNDGIVIIQDQELRFVNTMMTKLTGFSKQEATGKPFVDFIAPGYRKIVVERYKSRMAGKEVPSKYEIEIITKKGALVPVELSMSVIEYEGKPANMALMRDITERKRTEDALRTSENKFRQFFENEPAYAYMVSPKGVIIDINKAALKAFGYDKKELVGKPIEAMYAPESVPKMKQIFNKWKETGKVENEELTVKTKKGER